MMNSVVDFGTFYVWVKAFHIVAVIAWMAGMLYLPRLFVYHSETIPGSTESERFKVMERRLLRVIVNPAMVAVWALGLTLSLFPIMDAGPTGWLHVKFGLAAWHQGWFHAKLALVVIMSGVHGLYARWAQVFGRDANTHSARFYRVWNEVPTVLMMAIVILVVVQPFKG
jgi:putative membrane protein